MRLAICFLSLLLLANVAVAEPTRPNIIFILCDDLAQGDLGCYGQKLIQTPRLDQMAREGTRFTQAYCGTSVCAPSRTSLMTGFAQRPCADSRQSRNPARRPDAVAAEDRHRRADSEVGGLRDGVRRQVGNGHVRHDRQPARRRLRSFLRLQLPAPCPQLFSDLSLPRRRADRTAGQRRQRDRPNVCAESDRRRSARRGFGRNAIGRSSSSTRSRCRTAT